MRTSIFTALAALLMAMTGTAQTIVEAEGFFDTDPGVGNGIPLGNSPSGSSATITGSLPLNLTSGFHTFYVRCKASTNLWSNARGRTVYVNNNVNQQPVVQEIVACEYFIDSDPGVGNGVDVPLTASPTFASVVASVATAQSPGIHYVGVRFKASGGHWSNTRMRSFLVRIANDTPVADQIDAAEYFFDSDPGVGNGQAIAVDTPGLSVELTSSMAVNLTPGVHQLCVRIKSDLGYWSNARARTVLVSQESLLPTIHYIDAAEYYIDADPGQGNGTPIAVPTATTVDISELIDASGIAVGVHQLYIRVRSDQNIWSDFAMQEFTVSSGTDPVFVVQAINPLCANSNSGIIEVTTIGGTPPYAYAWNGTVGNDTLFNAAAGPNQLIVTDATGSVMLDTTITLVAPEPITAQSTVTPASAEGACDGSIILTVVGGTPPYDVSWNDPNATVGPLLTDVCAGQYAAAIIDDNGCTGASDVITITTGILERDNLAERVSISPNPGPGLFRVKLLTNRYADVHWAVTDSRGRIVAGSERNGLTLTAAGFEVDLSGMAAGLYHLNIGFNGQLSSHRLMLTGAH